MKKLSLLSVSLLVSFIVAIEIMASPYIPATPDTVIATWTKNKLFKPAKVGATEDEAIARTQDLLEQARVPGYSYLYGVAASTIKPWVQDNKVSIDTWLAWARIKQHQHRFVEAQQALTKVLAIHSKNINANLMMARIQVIQGNYSAAKQACLQLLGSSDLLTASTCLLDVHSYQGNLADSYKELKQMALRQNLKDKRRQWFSMTLADMANRLELWSEEEYWLNKYFQGNDISFLVAWSDNKLQLGKAAQVQEKLIELARQNPSIEDTLLLRLALAEKQLNQLQNSHKNNWQYRIAARIALREQREDIYHAGDVAIFYLDLQADPEKALHWARLNWQQVREVKDLKLLERAEQAHRENQV